MPDRGKKYQDAVKLVEHMRSYEPNEAMDLLKQTSYAGFDASAEAHIRLGVDLAQCMPCVFARVIFFPIPNSKIQPTISKHI